MPTPPKKSATKSKAKPRAAPAKKAQPKQAQSAEALRRELTEAREQQAATGDILRMIARSPADLLSVMGSIAENAARLCDAKDALIFLIEGEVHQRVAAYPLWVNADASRGHAGTQYPWHSGGPGHRRSRDDSRA